MLIPPHLFVVPHGQLVLEDAPRSGIGRPVLQHDPQQEFQLGRFPLLVRFTHRRSPTTGTSPP